jgi:hypothetical protein
MLKLLAALIASLSLSVSNSNAATVDFITEIFCSTCGAPDVVSEVITTPLGGGEFRVTSVIPISGLGNATVTVPAVNAGGVFGSNDNILLFPPSPGLWTANGLGNIVDQGLPTELSALLTCAGSDCEVTYGGVSHHVDRFTVTPTPVPAALPLFATGLGALGLLGWRRKRKAQAAT